MALIDKASLLMVPSVYEDGKLYNVLPSGNKAPDETGNHNGYDQTRADFTFSRDGSGASKATRVNSSGLIEKGRENLLKYSGDLTQSQWQNIRTSDSTGHTGYDGTTDALKIIPTTDNNTHRLDYVDTWSTGQVYTFSFYAKADGYNTIDVLIGGTTIGGNYGRFNLSTGTSSNVGTSIATSMEDVGSGWYRCQTAQVSGSTTRINIGVNDGTTQSYAGDGTSGILIQHPQLEKGLVATDYIETTTAAASAGLLGDMPRLDYSGGASSASLLLEPQRLNKISHSEYFGHSSWDNSNQVTRSISSTSSPEGKLNAYDIIPTTSNTNHTLRAPNLSGFTSGAVVNVSFFAKANGYKFISVVGGFGSSSTPAVVFNLDEGTITSGTGTIEDYDNGWYRCITPITLTATALYCVGNILDDNESGSFAGDGTSGIIVYGYQIEEASHPTSYIPTYGTAVARAADDCSVTGVSDVIGQTEGTLYIEFDHRYMASYPNEYIIDIEDSTHKLWIRKESAGNTLTSRLIVSGSNVWTIGISATDGIAKIALAYKSGDSAVYYNGNQIGTSSATYSGSSFDDLYFNLVGSSNPELNAKNLTLFKERLTNSELATLTTL